MSFSDPSFLISHRPTDQERHAAKMAAQERWESAQRAYQRASWLTALTMIYIALPLGLEKWHWHVVGGAGLLLVILGSAMAVKGAGKNALLSLLFAAVILPTWVKMAPTVLQSARQQVQVILSEWSRVF
jgi:hypothetical protein